MGKIFHVIDEEHDYGYNQKSHSSLRDHEEHMLEKAFKEGVEHGWRKAMKEADLYNERGRMRSNYREGFEETLERIKKKFE